MEFEFDDNLSAVRDLSESIFSAKSGVDRLREVEAPAVSTPNCGSSSPTPTFWEFLCQRKSGERDSEC